MRIAYVTQQTPFGEGEVFIIPEMRELVRRGVEVIVFPIRPGRAATHAEARELVPFCVRARAFALPVLVLALVEFLRRPVLTLRLLATVLAGSRNLRVRIKNFAMMPKALYAARIFRQRAVEHVHAHWASVSSTVALVASGLTGIPWSLTAHRWDIRENNLLGLKVRSASFVRCINQAGRQKTLAIAGPGCAAKVRVLHVGIDVPEAVAPPHQPVKRPFTVLCPALLVPVKGHRYLIEACALLNSRGATGLRCILAGSGPLEPELRRMVNNLGLDNMVLFHGMVPHERLMAMYSAGEVDAVVLPSIVTPDGHHEGTPVGLMEAMAFGIPVVATDTGGIAELIGDGDGVLVPQKDGSALADAIEKLATDSAWRGLLGSRGRAKVERDFNVKTVCSSLLDLWASAGAPGGTKGSSQERSA